MADMYAGGFGGGGGYNSHSPGGSFGGGGFMNESPGAGGGDKKGFTKGEKTTTPLLAAQIMRAKAENDKVMVDNKAVANIVLVGMVLTIDIQSTRVTLQLDDGTGIVQVSKYFSDEDTGNPELSGKDKQYVRINGQLKSSNGNKIVQAHKITPIRDFNEITFHNLDALNTHLKANKPSLMSSFSAVGLGMGGGAASFAPQQGAVLNQQGAVGAASGAGKDIGQQVLHIFATEGRNSDEGCHIDDVVRQLPHFKPIDIKNAIQYLVDDGQLYSTTDEEHYKSTSD